MIQPLPIWVLTNKYPAIYDGESSTAIEMVAKVYGKMDEMIKDYNTFVTEINNAIAEFEGSINADFIKFKEDVLKITSDYIACVDMKIANQDSKIADAIQYMKDNIIQTTQNIINQAMQDGTITVGFTYDAENERLDLIVQEGE